jgi:hypothetical protein
MAITINFKGICTHLPPTGERNAAHRVVLVRADHGAYLKDSKIPPHIPKMHIDHSGIDRIEGARDGLVPIDDETWRLCGVHLTLEGTRGGLQPDPAPKVPRLRMDSENPPPLSMEVVTMEQAACYFDLLDGMMTSEETEHGAIYAVVNVETSEAPILQVKCFWNRKITSIYLRPGATIDIEHMGAADGESEMDFLLHYRVFDRIDAKPFVPHEPKKKALGKGYGNISVGCSNSQYP